MEPAHLHEFASRIGVMRVAAAETGLCRLDLPGSDFKESEPFFTRHGWYIEEGCPEILREAEDQIHRYLDGRLQSFSIPLDLRGTPFQTDVYGELLKIPYGRAASYSDVAARIGKPAACRAVGQAVHRNPAAIVVPCHRVLGKDRSLTGFGGGLAMKELLLKLEGFENFR